MKKHFDIAGTSARFLAGEMSEKEKNRFLKHLKQDKTMEEEFEKMRETWNSIGTDPTGKYNNTGSAWETLKNRLDRDGLLDEPAQSPRTTGYYLLRTAAAIALLVVVSIAAYLLFSGRSTLKYQTIAYDDAHASTGYDLPDGSHVYLNMGAEVKLPSDFSENRTLILKGEGFFDVSHDPSRPFSVNAGNTIITVLGTSFNVKENKTDKMVEIFVESGKVKVRGKHSTTGITLLPGQFGISDGENPIISLQDNSNYLSWKTREFRFVNTSLDQILETLGQAYHVKVDTGNVNVSALKLTSTYYNQSFDSVFKTICTAFNLTYTRTEKGYRLTGR